MAERELAQITFENGYACLIDAMRARAQERRIAITSESFAAVCGLPSYYPAKLLAAHPVRRIGMISLAPMLAELSIKLIVVEDERALALYGKRLENSNQSCAHYNDAITFKFTRRHMQKIGRKGLQIRWSESQRKIRAARVNGGSKSRKNMTPQQASAIARKAIQARWAKAAAKAEAA
jgi:hypothetical protein